MLAKWLSIYEGSHFLMNNFSVGQRQLSVKLFHALKYKFVQEALCLKKEIT